MIEAFNIHCVSFTAAPYMAVVPNSKPASERTFLADGGAEDRDKINAF
jgi:hypothetical protein